MRNYRIIIVAFIALFILNKSYSQECKAIAKLDTNNILIGDHLHVRLSVTAPLNAKTHIPPLTQAALDTFHIELIACSVIDTTRSEAHITYKQTITITSFDSGFYLFPAIPIFNADTQILAYTEPLPFFVHTIAVDTSAVFYDIKNIVKMPLTFKEIAPILFTALIITVVIMAAILLYFRYSMKKRKPKQPVKPVVPKTKAHIVALQALEELRLKKLWEKGLIKPYYSELTDILRYYIENRYEIGALEMVTNEIMDAIAAIDITIENRNDLFQLLNTADLVKFAKWNPLPSDNDLSFSSAITFVKNTAETSNNKSEEPEKKR